MILEEMQGVHVISYVTKFVPVSSNLVFLTKKELSLMVISMVEVDYHR